MSQMSRQICSVSSGRNAVHAGETALWLDILDNLMFVIIAVHATCGVWPGEYV